VHQQKKQLEIHNNKKQKIMAFKLKGQSMYSSSVKSHVKGHGKQQGPVGKSNVGLRKDEHPDTYVYDGKNRSERIGDYEDRSEFAAYDGNKKTAEFLQREADIIRDKPRKKTIPFNKYKKK